MYKYVNCTCLQHITALILSEPNRCIRSCSATPATASVTLVYTDADLTLVSFDVPSHQAVPRPNGGSGMSEIHHGYCSTYANPVGLAYVHTETNKVWAGCAVHNVTQVTNTTSGIVHVQVEGSMTIGAIQLGQAVGCTLGSGDVSVIEL